MVLNVTHYKVCPLFGTVELHYSFYMRGKLHNKSTICPDEMAAQRVLKSNRRTALLLEIENFLLHKKAIINGGMDKNNMLKQQNLAKAFKAIEALQERPFEIICRHMVNNQDSYRTLLPSYNNASRLNSESKLETILAFCKEHLPKEQTTKVA
jgi:hypothetical protein